MIFKINKDDSLISKTLSGTIIRRLLCVTFITLVMLTLSACGRNVADSARDIDYASASETIGESDNNAIITEPFNEDELILSQSSDENAAITITALKAGAADAFVLQTENHVTLIDTGLDKKGDDLVDFLNKQGITYIDEMIITHFDKDHVGGADHVIYAMEIGQVYATYQIKTSNDIDEYNEALDAVGVKETVVTNELSFYNDDVTFTIYPPESRSYKEKESNNSSLVVRVSVGDYSMLFAGDAEEERIQELLKTPGLQSTILKVPHHGRYALNTEALIRYVNPEFAIITSSGSEPEDDEVIDILEKNGVDTFLTRKGDITIALYEDGVTIQQ